MHFFFTSIQVISSLNSTNILWYPKGEKSAAPAPQCLAAQGISVDTL